MEPQCDPRRSQMEFIRFDAMPSQWISSVRFHSHWLYIWFILYLLPDSSKAAGGDCLSGNMIDCFECNSWDDPRCHDPFNYTLHKYDMPPLKECGGCCVKMVQFIGTEHYQVKRTCTDTFEVNFFIVNHACMTEGHRHGHMCFCEEDECNHQSPTSLPSSLCASIGLQILLMLLFQSCQNVLLS
ncbi:protein quiver-like isoform X2 [Tigriopus californicus]|uniref:protein quiver-like isoform X2 n=1 Tax=Tigriopus californicus TaxID=6832 RepID=UPI0027D9E59E|nr:protein quiver-like isoform X2 [Tigriopus californicus]